MATKNSQFYFLSSQFPRPFYRVSHHDMDDPATFDADCFMQSVFVEELHTMCDTIFDKKASNHQPVDFHDVMFKFTLDSFVRWVTFQLDLVMICI